MKHTELENIRREIDAADDELLALFTKRMALSRKAAEYKKINSLPAADSDREADILRRLTLKAGPGLSSYAGDFFGGLLSISRSYQDASTHRYGLVGADSSHSYSKAIHEMFGYHEYELMSMDAKEFAALIGGRDFDGLNITAPYKKAAIAYCDEVSPIAAEIGSVNTVYKKDGRLVGTNTDYDGFLYTLKRSGIGLKGRKVLILGAGGVSLTIQKCAKEEGAGSISVAGRGHDFSCERDAEIIINATPVGSFPDDGGMIADPADFPRCAGVIDVVYNPLYTDLLLGAKDLGIPFSNGLPMLVAQASAAASLFTGNDYTALNEETLGRLLSAVQNVVLIGMPGAGKSTLGKRLALALGKDFADTDDAVSAKAGMPVSEVFEKFGEQRFRDMETEAAKEYGRRRGFVIATGGGCVLRKENMDALRRNAVTIFLDRPLEALETQGRPLSKDLPALTAMHAERRPLYEKYGDYRLSDI